MSRARIPVALIAAPGGAERSALLARWLDARPAGERWAVLVEGAVGALAAAGGAPGGDAAPGAGMASGAGTASGAGSKAPGVYVVALGGCACCTGATVLRVTLTRLLRAGGLDRILVVVGAAARPDAVAAMLSAPPFDALLEPCSQAPAAT